MPSVCPAPRCVVSRTGSPSVLRCRVSSRRPHCAHPPLPHVCSTLSPVPGGTHFAIVVEAESTCHSASARTQGLLYRQARCWSEQWGQRERGSGQEGGSRGGAHSRCARSGERERVPPAASLLLSKCVAYPAAPLPLPAAPDLSGRPKGKIRLNENRETTTCSTQRSEHIHQGGRM